jgi:Fur family ferric uptake transcriptional regulator
MPDNPIDLLLEHGLQVTPQRLTVLRVVAAHPHITADRVAELVRAEIGAISRQAVYNVLGALVDKGILRKIQPHGSPSLYEDRVADNHHHLICRACGRVVDIDCAVGAAPCLQVGDDRGYRIDEAEVIYWGRCPACLVQAEAPDAPARPGSDQDRTRG